MRKENVRNPSDALVYLTDCNLATVEHMAGLKSRNKSEYIRQKEISQTSINWIITMKLNPTNTRAEEVIDKYNGNVENWSNDLYKS